jgi:hypothetical protein
LGHLRSVTVTTFTFKLGAEPDAKLFERDNSTAVAETSSVASRPRRVA